MKDDGSLAAADDLTEIKAGYIVVEGQLLKRGDSLADLCYVRHDAQKRPPRDSKTVPNFEEYRRSIILPDTREEIFDPPSDKRLAILHLGIWEWWWDGTLFGTPRFTRKFAGLLLRQVDDTGTKYERVGVIMKQVRFLNVTSPVGRAFQPEDEQFLKVGWDRTKITVV